MFARKHFDVLIVDDDPDVLAVSKVALKNLRFANASLKLHAFESKHAAIEFLQSLPDPTTLAVVITDVVMESDTAGLELCSYLRVSLKNDLSQLIVRTGQATKAPQRQVLEAYEINGYLSKGEVNHESLGNVVISSLRNYEWALTSLLLYRLFNTLLPGFRTRDDIFAALRRFVTRTLEGDSGLGCNAMFRVDGTDIGFGTLADLSYQRTLHQRLQALEGRKLSDQGDTYRIDQDNDTTFHALFELGQDRGNLMPRVSLLATVPAQPPEVQVTSWLRALYSLRRLIMIADFIGRLRDESASGR